MPYYIDHSNYNDRKRHHHEVNRTQHKLQLQRLSFLTNDKDYIDHPANMKRLTKELERVNREYRSVRRFQDPLSESLKRLSQQHWNIPQTSSSISINTTSSSSSSAASSTSSERGNFMSRWFQAEEKSGHPAMSINRRAKN
ncbi:hypothetical protein K501DRAFT_288264 [Backusella circina FSU 941]|nr:hypothetical protein K501DRAFT_288264 [Backusella circina FSU 941]